MKKKRSLVEKLKNANFWEEVSSNNLCNWKALALLVIAGYIVFLIGAKLGEINAYNFYISLKSMDVFNNSWIISRTFAFICIVLLIVICIALYVAFIVIIGTIWATIRGIFAKEQAVEENEDEAEEEAEEDPES